MRKAQYLFWLYVVLLTGCSLQLVATYDPQTEMQATAIEKKVDYFYRTIQLKPVNQRPYREYEKNYLEIEVDIRALLRRQQRRVNNQETIKQVDMLATLWSQDKNAHQQSDSISDFTIKRRISQYQRMFTAIINGEMAKKTD